MKAGPRRCKVDANHAECVAALQGREHIELARYGCPIDLAVYIARGQWLMLEVKRPGWTGSDLTDTERDMWERGAIDIVTTPQETADAVGRAIRRWR